MVGVQPARPHPLTVTGDDDPHEKSGFKISEPRRGHGARNGMARCASTTLRRRGSPKASRMASPAFSENLMRRNTTLAPTPGMLW